jgi:hypothetical protein
MLIWSNQWAVNIQKHSENKKTVLLGVVFLSPGLKVTSHLFFENSEQPNDVLVPKKSTCQKNDRALKWNCNFCKFERIFNTWFDIGQNLVFEKISAKSTVL